MEIGVLGIICRGEYWGNIILLAPEITVILKQVIYFHLECVLLLYVHVFLCIKIYIYCVICHTSDSNLFISSHYGFSKLFYVNRYILTVLQNPLGRKYHK